MLIRLLGAEEEASRITVFTFPFEDVPNWGKGYVQYAYENGLTKGVSKTKFGSNNLIDAKSYLTFYCGHWDTVTSMEISPGKKPPSLPWKRHYQ